MAWEIAKHFKLDGEEVKVWQGRDAEGRRIYHIASESDRYEPSGGLYSQKAAVEEYLHHKTLK
jgi:hypothetical protein